MNSSSLLLIALASLLSVSCDAYRILGIFPLNGKSHDVMMSSLTKSLAERGHQVDVITHFPPKNPPKNYKVVVNLAGTIPNMMNNFSIEFARTIKGNPTYIVAGKFGNELCELMGLREVQRLVKNPPKDPPYDLVIVHTFGANCFMGFGHLLKVPVVAVSTSAELPWMTDFIGNDDNPAVSSGPMLLDFDRKNFWHRLNNFFSYHWHVYLFHSLTEESQTKAMRKYLDPSTPGIREVERSVALTLVNRHSSIYGAKPIVQSLVEVAGLHIDSRPAKLSAELQKWLDEAKAGAVYFTFGSMVCIETLPRNTTLDIYRSLEKLAPIRVVMKIADSTKLPPDLPDNVLTLPWIPQQAVLNHENVRVFLTHGGLMGCQEALYYGVPLIGVPLFGDQMLNVNTFVEKNTAVLVDFENLTSLALDEAFDKVLNDPKYRQNAKYYSKLFKDRPLNATETATFWIEYVIRNGASILRSPAHELRWWQLAMLDVYGFVLSCLVIAVILLRRLANLLSRLLFSRQPPKKVKKQ